MSNNGVILERLSGKKLSVLVSILLALQIVCFLIGAIKFPHATHTETVEGVMCRDKAPSKAKGKTVKTADETRTYYLRDYLGRVNSNCDRIEVDENRNTILNARQNEIVYAFQIPLPREDRVLRLNRLFQTMTSILQFQIVFPPNLNKKEAGLFNESVLNHEIPEIGKSVV